MTTKRLLPYTASTWTGKKMWEVLGQVRSPHRDDRERADIIHSSLQEAWQLGESQAASDAFKFGLVAGGALTLVVLSGLYWLGRMLL